ncbi:MAG: T9SS type A sorting domain-containing protein [Flavobacteriales bacterium]
MRMLLLTACILPCVVSAQSWCPPGATWVHDYADYMMNRFGVTRVVYEDDSLVGGFTAQKLRETNVIAPWGSTDFQSHTFPPMLTWYNDDVVHVWDAFTGTFDTLMWFSAEPGDHWSPPHFWDDPFYRLQVLDTSTVVIDGEPLRQLIVQLGDWDGIPPDTLRERLGFSLSYMNGWSWFATDMPWAGLRCYRDAEISYTRPNVSDCGYTLSIEESIGESIGQPVPNPGTDSFTINLPPGAWTIDVLDALGRRMLTTRSNSERLDVDATALALGTYLVRISGATGNSITRLWTKQ